jgi:hypothetical protein
MSFGDDFWREKRASTDICIALLSCCLSHIKLINNHDIIYIFQIEENFLHLFGNLHESCTYVLERHHSNLGIQVIMQIELASDILQEPIWGKYFYMMSSLVYSFS